MSLPDQDFIEKIKGFLHPEEGLRLYELALDAARTAPCLEIGGYCGKSALYLGAACLRRGATLFSVDHHGGSAEQQPGELYFDPELFDARSYRVDSFRYFRRTIEAAGLQETVVPLVCTSRTAARDWAIPLSLVFIDAGHDFESVYEDFRLWSPHLAAGGYLAFHDVFADPADGGQGPYRVFQRAVSQGCYRVLPMTGSLAVLRRRY